MEGEFMNENTNKDYDCREQSIWHDPNFRDIGEDEHVTRLNGEKITVSPHASKRKMPTGLRLILIALVIGFIAELAWCVYNNVNPETIWLIQRAAHAVLPDKTIETSARLTNMHGVTLADKQVDDYWILDSEEEVLIWMDLPDCPEDLCGKLISTFPYEVTAGETGVVNLKLKTDANITYKAQLKFQAADDLTLETGVQHKLHGNSGQIEFHNDTSYEMCSLTDILGPGRKSYVHYSLYTSGTNGPVAFRGGSSSIGYYMTYDVKAVGDFNKKQYVETSSHIYDPDLDHQRLPLEDPPADPAEEEAKPELPKPSKPMPKPTAKPMPKPTAKPMPKPTEKPMPAEGINEENGNLKPRTSLPER